MAPGGSPGRSDQYVPGGSTALIYPYGHRLRPRSWASAQSSTVLGAKDINTDPGCGRAMYPDRALSSNTCLDNTMAPLENTGHPNRPGHRSSIALRYQYGNRLWPRPRPSTWLLVATWARDINTDPSCDGTMDPEMVLGSSPGPRCHHGSQLLLRTPN